MMLVIDWKLISGKGEPEWWRASTMGLYLTVIDRRTFVEWYSDAYGPHTADGEADTVEQGKERAEVWLHRHLRGR